MRKRKLLCAQPAKLLLNRHQQSDILLDRETADEARAQSLDRSRRVPRAIAIRGRERLGVDAACHQVAGPSGDAFKQCAKFRVRREEHARLPVVECAGPKRGGFDLPTDAGAARAEEACEPSGAGGCVLMHVGVPGGDQRHAQVVRDPGADEAKLRRVR